MQQSGLTERACGQVKVAARNRRLSESPTSTAAPNVNVNCEINCIFGQYFSLSTVKMALDPAIMHFTTLPYIDWLITGKTGGERDGESDRTFLFRP